MTFIIIFTKCGFKKTIRLSVFPLCPLSFFSWPVVQCSLQNEETASRDPTRSPLIHNFKRSIQKFIALPNFLLQMCHRVVIPFLEDNRLMSNTWWFHHPYNHEKQPHKNRLLRQICQVYFRQLVAFTSQEGVLYVTYRYALHYIC